MSLSHLKYLLLFILKLIKLKLGPILIKILLIEVSMHVMNKRQKNKNNSLNFREFQLLLILLRVFRYFNNVREFINEMLHFNT